MCALRKGQSGIPSSVSPQSLSDAELLSQCSVDTYRASGPGGQKRNKTVSAVRLRHESTGQTVVATESRSQHENKARALKRLRRAIALNVRSAVDASVYERSETLISCMSRAGKLQVGRRDHRFNDVVRELLDVLVASDIQVSTAAALVGVSTSALVNFLRNEPAVWRKVDELRKAAGHPSLK